MKLLVSPLYGDRPEVGLRELLQNAVDACRELEDFCKHQSSKGSLEGPKQKFDVVITAKKIENGNYKMTLSDHGIGMTVDVIQNYFLCAGSSFRRSDVWKKQHTTKEGKARILRSGRFGVGVLAAFLLGEKIRVSTRHVTDENGIEFECGIDDDAVEINRIERPIGTTIEVEISDPRIIAKLPTEHYNRGDSWIWYYLENPSVKFTINRKEIKPKIMVQSEKEKLSHQWRRIQHDDYADIHWSYWNDYAVPDLVCNGIKIQ